MPRRAFPCQDFFAKILDMADEANVISVVVKYVVWGIFLVPWRLLRRGSRKRKKAELQHRETMTALAAQQAQMDQMQQQGQQPVPPPAG